MVQAVRGAPRVNEHGTVPPTRGSIWAVSRPTPQTGGPTALPGNVRSLPVAAHRAEQQTEKRVLLSRVWIGVARSHAFVTIRQLRIRTTDWRRLNATAIDAPTLARAPVVVRAGP